MEVMDVDDFETVEIVIAPQIASQRRVCSRAAARLSLLHTVSPQKT